jgi:nicotinamidase-related amidase
VTPEPIGASLLDRDACMLIVVDAQPGFLRKPWFSERDVADSEAALDRLVWLVAVASRLSIPIVVTEEEPEHNGSTDVRVRDWLPPGTAILSKVTFSVAAAPEVLAAVEGTGRRRAIVVGCETDVCVAQSAIDLAASGLAVTVVDDATFSPGEMHARGLDRLASAGIARNHAKGITYEWIRTVDDAHAILHGGGLPTPPFRL